MAFADEQNLRFIERKNTETIVKFNSQVQLYRFDLQNRRLKNRGIALRKCCDQHQRSEAGFAVGQSWLDRPEACEEIEEEGCCQEG